MLKLRKTLQLYLYFPRKGLLDAGFQAELLCQTWAGPVVKHVSLEGIWCFVYWLVRRIGFHQIAVHAAHSRVQ